jgi:hypothetical protein
VKETVKAHEWAVELLMVVVVMVMVMMMLQNMSRNAPCVSLGSKTLPCPMNLHTCVLHPAVYE